jgi:alpha-mannosidase
VPAERAFLRRLLDEGRCELVGGTYNEPNTNLTVVESTIRNLAYGIALQRDVLGGDPETAWQLDAFGHDPQFPGLCAGAGLTASSWARGPFHQWGPIQTHGGYGDARVMQFPSEFEWVAPSGAGLLTAYMPAHYSAGWWMDSAPTLAEAETAVHDLFRSLQPVAATRNVLIPVGTDYSPPNKWVTEIHRDWNARYTWPRFVCAVPRDFLAAVRAELSAEGRAPVPVSRDMNPVYTGKDVSYIGRRRYGSRTASGSPPWPRCTARASRTRPSTGAGGSCSTAPTTTLSPAARATRSTSTCWPAGGTPGPSGAPCSPAPPGTSCRGWTPPARAPR